MTRDKVRLPERSESSIEASACEIIKQALPSVLIKKMNGFSDRHWPDRMLLYKGGRILFLEFKRPGEKANPAQAWFFDELRKLGFPVEVVDSVADAKYAALLYQELAS